MGGPEVRPYPPIAPVPGGIRLTLHIQPRASRTELAGLHGDALKIRLAAPPVDGAANEALIEFIAGRLGVPRGSVVIRHGETARRKVVEVRGMSVEDAVRRFEVGSL